MPKIGFGILYCLPAMVHCGTFRRFLLSLLDYTSSRKIAIVIPRERELGVTRAALSNQRRVLLSGEYHAHVLHTQLVLSVNYCGLQ